MQHVRFSENTLPQSEAIERPLCLDCSKPMWLTRVVPYRLRHDQRFFECPVCLQEQAIIVKYK